MLPIKRGTETDVPANDRVTSATNLNARHPCACRKLNPGISVMEPAQDWATKNVPGAIDGARDRCVFLQG
jgi:hypothetical protein